MAWFDCQSFVTGYVIRNRLKDALHGTCQPIEKKCPLKDLMVLLFDLLRLRP